MIRLHAPALPLHALDFLADQQRAIDALPDYAARVTEGEARWDRKSNTNAGKQALQAIRDALAGMAPTQRCHYCEDSCADEVEHFKPKNLYPGLAFVWDNYLYACGPCNGSHKRDRWAVFDLSGAVVEVTRGRSASVSPPQAGADVPINPRLEDPLAFFHLDLEMGLLMERDRDPHSLLHKRAKYTCELLDLNRGELLEQRQAAYEQNLDTLSQYAERSIPTPPPDRLAKLETRARRAISRSHRTVWAEMKRQAHLIEDLAFLFDVVPKARDW